MNCGRCGIELEGFILCTDCHEKAKKEICKKRGEAC